MANKVLIDFEQHVGLGPAAACRLIGIAYPTYAAYRNESRPLQPYHRNHVADIQKLPRRTLKQLIEERIA